MKPKARQRFKKKKMLIVNNRAGSKEPMKEGGEDQNKIKTSNQAGIAPREELGWEQWTTGEGQRASGNKYGFAGITKNC